MEFLNSNSRKDLLAADYLFYLYLTIAFIFLILIGIPAINRDIDFAFYADSGTYLDFARSNLKINEIFILWPNMFGPIFLLRLVNLNHYLIFFLQVLIALYFYRTFVSFFSIHRIKFFFFLAISSIFFTSIILINKEIYALLSISFLFRYYSTRKSVYFISALLVAIFVRWQMILFVTTMLFLISYKPFLRRPYYYLSILLLLISVVYFVNYSLFSQINEILILAKEDGTDEGGGSFFTLVAIQNSNPFGYALVLIPKFLHFFLALITRYYNVFELSNLHNNVILFLQVLGHWILILVLIKKILVKKFDFKNIFFLTAVVYIIIFGLSPIYAPRYFFPAYILIVLAVTSPIDLASSKKVG
jgi:hypothetical protein